MSVQQTKLAPGLLVAVPQLMDPNFVRSVVFLITHDGDGAFGLVLNRPADLDIRSVADQLGIGEDAPEQPLYVGGPVETNRGFLLHGGPGLDASEEVQPGIHLSGAPEDLQRCFRDGLPFRLFVGYSGWGPGQLEQELAKGAWIAAPSQPDYVFGSASGELWETVLRDVGIDPATLSAGGGIN